MKSFLLSALILGVSAYPQLMEEAELFKRQSAAQAISKAEQNCGPQPCPTFSESDQFVSTTGNHAYASPLANQIRGPCPGLNAAANHGYLPRSGVLTPEDTATGLLQAYGFEPVFGAALAAFAIVTSGDIVAGTWSIGGPQPYINVLGLLSSPQGISYSHAKYEGDVSITRNDAYLGHGDAHSVNVTRFTRVYETGIDDDSYTLDKFRGAYGMNLQDSIMNNPYYFSPLIAGVIVPPGAYNFIINMMSNHSAANPNGYLNGAILKSFFAISGEYPNFVWNKGQERIPENWYRRPSYNLYGAARTVEDLGIGYAAYPDNFRLGGNTNGVNTYKGIDVATLSGGQYTNANILANNNFGCLAFQSMELLLPDELKGTINKITPAIAFLNKFNAPIIGQLGCPALDNIDDSVFSPFPGYKYNPTGMATNYKE